MASTNSLFDLASRPLMVYGAGFLVFVTALYIYLLPKPLPGIPYNEESARRVMGDVPEFLALAKAGRRPRDFWANLCANHNSAIAQYFPGPFMKPIVVVSDFREAQDLFVRRSKQLDRGYVGRLMWEGVGDHHFVAMDASNPKFHQSRFLGKDLMSPNYLQTVSAPIGYSNVESMIELWKYKVKFAEGRPFKIIQDLMALTADTIFETAIGIEGSDKNIYQYLRRLESTDLAELKPDSRDAIYPFPEYECEGLLKCIDDIAHVVGKFPTAPILSLHWPIHDLRPSVKKAKHDRYAIIQTYIDRALERWQSVGPPQKPRWAIDLIIAREQTAAKKEDRQPDYRSKMFHDALFGYCFGGQDTTHSALSFLVKHFGMYQEPQRKLRAALREAHAAAVSERRAPTSDEICRAQIPYLDAYIEEVLRLNTTASAVIKETIEDIEILGCHVPKGTQLFVPLWGASIDSPALPTDESKRSKSSQEHAKDTPTDWTGCGYPPGVFHPERWMRKDPETGKIVFNARAGPHMTFSAGQRECWGKRLAMITLRLVTTLMVWNFDFLPLPEGMDSLEVTDILNAKPSVCLVSLKPIEL